MGVRVAFEPLGARSGGWHEEARGLGTGRAGQSGQHEGQYDCARHCEESHAANSATQGARPRAGYGFVTTTRGNGDAAVGR